MSLISCHLSDLYVFWLSISVSLFIKIAVTSLVWKYFSSFGVRFIFTAIKFWPFRCFVSWSRQSWGEALFMREKIKKRKLMKIDKKIDYYSWHLWTVFCYWWEREGILRISRTLWNWRNFVQYFLNIYHGLLIQG